MGIIDRFKALALPAGAIAQNEQQIAAASQPQMAAANPMPRDPDLANSPFPAGMPLIPALINRPREDGRADPRRSEFPVAWNLQVSEQRAVPFRVLREVADTADIVRKCIEVVKAAIVGMIWDVSIAEDAIARTMAESQVGSTQAAKLVREKYQADITRAKDFWKSPDRINGMTFQEWIGVMLEEVLVIDALSIYPNRTLDNKKLHSLEILDGATIKPLLDARGARPTPPNPAFQQILFGFPRSEFTASADADGEFTADDLFYSPRTRRTNTPYGFSPVERALPIIDLYMKRLHWFRTEFTDGVMPDLMMKSDMEFGNNPELLRGYEQVFNDALSGNIEQRRRMRLLPNGFDPVIPKISDAKYSSDFDDFLVKSVCGHFGVMPSQIGFTPKHGLGGAGHQAGEAESAETLGLRPILSWVIDILNQLSIRFLGMPQDLTFVFSNGTDEDMTHVATRRQLEMYSGQKTWNEIRTEMGLPLFTFPEADAPLLIQSGTITPLSASFESFAIDAVGQDNDEPDQVQSRVNEIRDDQQDENDVSNQVKAELGTFIKWAKAEKARPFEFTVVGKEDADRLNALVAVDAHAARDLAQVLRKAGDARPKAGPVREPLPKNHPARAASDRLVAIYTEKFASLGGVNPEKVATEWLANPNVDPVGWLASKGWTALDIPSAVETLMDLYQEAGWMGRQAGQALVRHARKRTKKIDWIVDWKNWVPGQPDAAIKLWGEYGFGDGLQQLLDKADITIQSIDETRMNALGTVLGDAVSEGLSVSETADLIRDLLNNPSRAEMIAHTEMARATSAAQMDVFVEDGVTEVEWQTSGDEHVCEDCLFNEAASPYPIADAPEPPEHPLCGCMLLPTAFGNDPNIEGIGELDEDMELAAQPDIVKVRRSAVDKALDRLADIPDAKPGVIAVPWSIKARSKVPTNDWADSKMGLFVIEELSATQKYLRRETLEWQLNNLGLVETGQNAHPNVVIHKGDAKIHDGHHRLAALWLMDVDCANCWTLNIDE